MKSFSSVRIEKREGVVTISLVSPGRSKRGTGNIQSELGEAIADLRTDDSVRVIVLTGAGDQFLVPKPGEEYHRAAAKASYTNPAEMWRTFSGIARTIEGMLQIDKPIIAKVNGDAAGFGSSLVFASDLIIAKQDAVVVDTHLGVGEYPFGSPFGIVPGDGGILVSMYLSPALAKEYLMLARSFTGAELARMGIINQAVRSDELDAVVAELVGRLLARPAFSLAWTKRIMSQLAIQRISGLLDASMAYEMTGFLQFEKDGWKARRSLT